MSLQYPPTSYPYCQHCHKGSSKKRESYQNRNKKNPEPFYYELMYNNAEILKENSNNKRRSHQQVTRPARSNNKVSNNQIPEAICRHCS
jgi:hypothetical protein